MMGSFWSNAEKEENSIRGSLYLFVFPLNKEISYHVELAKGIHVEFNTKSTNVIQAKLKNETTWRDWCGGIHGFTNHKTNEYIIIIAFQSNRPHYCDSLTSKPSAIATILYSDQLDQLMSHGHGMFYYEHTTFNFSNEPKFSVYLRPDYHFLEKWQSHNLYNNFADKLRNTIQYKGDILRMKTRWLHYHLPAELVAKIEFLAKYPYHVRITQERLVSHGYYDESNYYRYINHLGQIDY